MQAGEGWGAAGVPLPPRKALARRGAFAAKQILFQTSPLPPGGEGVSGPSPERPGRCWSSPSAPTAPRPARLRAPAAAAPLGFAGERVARLCQAALRRESARRKKERDRGRGRGRGDARSRRLGEGARTREGAGRDPWAASAPRRRTAPAGGRLSAQPGPGRGHLGPSARPAGPGKELRAGAPVTFLALGPGRGRAVSGRARSGRPGPCGAPGTAAAAEGHREEGASHVGAPRPPPASERDEVGGAAAAGRAPAGGGDRRGGAAPPLPSETLPPGRIQGGSRGASSRASAHDPGPPLSPEAQILPPATATPSVWTGRGPPPQRLDKVPHSHPLPPVRGT